MDKTTIKELIKCNYKKLLKKVKVLEEEASTHVESVKGDGVNNIDPLNPIIDLSGYANSSHKHDISDIRRLNDVILTLEDEIAAAEESAKQYTIGITDTKLDLDMNNLSDTLQNSEQEIIHEKLGTEDIVEEGFRKRSIVKKTVFVDYGTGDNATAEVENRFLPFEDIETALLAIGATTDSDNWKVIINNTILSENNTTLIRPYNNRIGAYKNITIESDGEISFTGYYVYQTSLIIKAKSIKSVNAYFNAFTELRLISEEDNTHIRNSQNTHQYLYQNRNKNVILQIISKNGKVEFLIEGTGGDYGTWGALIRKQYYNAESRIEANLIKIETSLLFKSTLDVYGSIRFEPKQPVPLIFNDVEEVRPNIIPNISTFKGDFFSLKLKDYNGQGTNAGGTTFGIIVNKYIKTLANFEFNTIEGINYTDQETHLFGGGGIFNVSVKNVRLKGIKLINAGKLNTEGIWVFEQGDNITYTEITKTRVSGGGEITKAIITGLPMIINLPENTEIGESEIQNKVVSNIPLNTNITVKGEYLQIANFIPYTKEFTTWILN